MGRFLLQAAVSALGLWLAEALLPGISVDGFVTLILAAVLLGVANAVVKPILVFITFPITLITFGLFLLVVNAAVLGLVALVLPGFAIAGFWAALLGALIVSLVSWAAGLAIRDERK